ncbi:MAG TPA: DUF2085 domain-containing protein [Ignavibacteria bacterium]|nr:DUF2085 domain-containing protein [Ignavibacteria bacterium]
MFLFPNSNLIYLLYPVLKISYGTVCNQIDAKTFYLNGHELLVGARCTGIYIGTLLTSFLSLFTIMRINLSIKYFLIALIPMGIDVFFSTIGLYHYSKLLAFATGLLFGSIIFMFILNTVENIFLHGFREK